MKPVIIFWCSLIFIPSNASAMGITTLSCVDDDGPELQMIVQFDDTAKIVFEGDPSSSFVSDEIISWKDKGTPTTTVIYRSTGRYNVKKGSRIIFGGYCTKLEKNKF